MVDVSPDLIAGRYRLMNRIGSGGMGHVWLAWDERLSRAVAVKQLHSPVGLDEADARVAHARAMREARNTARLHHPNAVPVFDVVDHDGQPCLVMQYLPSRSLHAVLAERGPLPVREVAQLGAELGSALAAAHRADIVHRDVKPGNVLVAEDGTARITDFGISHAVGDVSLTSTGMVTGTPAYLAPEVARGAPSSPASDVFSLGATLYAAVEGSPPFGTGNNPMALLHRVASGSITPPGDGPLAPVLLAMLAASPDDRPSMQDVSADLAEVAAGRPPRGPVAPPGAGTDLRPDRTRVLPV
ncbi:serine/threonine-protein kinase, partial [Terrabacter sp. RAF57]